MTKNPKRPADVNKRAKSVVDLATGDASEAKPRAGQSAGGQKGAAARASKLSPEEREEIARVAAQARWKKGGN